MEPTKPRLLPTLACFLLVGLTAALVPHPALGTGLLSLPEISR